LVSHGTISTGSRRRNPENIIYLSQLILSVIRQNTRGANRIAEFEELANELHGLLEEGKIPSTGIVALGLMETGRALYGFRLYEQAIYFLQRAQHLYRAFNPTDPSSLLTTTHYLGLSYRHMGNLGDAERQLKDALAMADAIRSADSKARVEHDLANVLMQQGRKDEAIFLNEAALRTGGGNGVKTKGNLALLYAERGRFAEAEGLLREQMQLLENESPRNEQDIVETRANMIAVLGLSGKVNEAIPLIKDNMRLAERMKDDFLLIISKIALAGAYNDTNRHEEALSLLRQLRTDVTGQHKGFGDLFASTTKTWGNPCGTASGGVVPNGC
jgi:tetratricopeptide (TPR) repeat protein